jgi:hypothetical protein
VGDVAVVLLARRQGEVAVGVELEMDAESTMAHGPPAFLLRSNGSDDFTHPLHGTLFDMSSYTT